MHIYEFLSNTKLKVLRVENTLRLELGLHQDKVEVEQVRLKGEKYFALFFIPKGLISFGF